MCSKSTGCCWSSPYSQSRKYGRLFCGNRCVRQVGASATVELLMQRAAGHPWGPFLAALRGAAEACRGP